MTLLSDFGEMLNAGTGRRRYQVTDPNSPQYGNWTAGPNFPVAYQKMGAAEVQRLGREVGTEMYMVIADFDAGGNRPVSERERLEVVGIAEIDVVESVPYPQAEWDGVLIRGEVT